MADRLDDLATLTGWTPEKDVAKIIPLFHLIRRYRNTVVHHDSVVGDDLATYASSKEVDKALLAFRSEFSKADLPILPVFHRGDQVVISPTVSILFGAVLYELAKSLNSYVCSKMKDTEFVEMAFHYSTLVDEHPFRTILHRTPEARVRYFLDARYSNRHDPVEIDVIRHLRRICDTEIKNAPEGTSLWTVAYERHLELLKKHKST